MPKLIFNIEREFPQVRDLEPGKITIGRNSKNQILLNESSVSDFHAVLTNEESGSCCLKNLSLEDATVVNAEPVKESVSLKHGDQIRFGSVKAVFEDVPENSDSNGYQGNGLKGLIRKGEVERNNLRLLENDAKWMRSEIEDTLRRKDDLEAKLEELKRDIDTADAHLNEKRQQTEKLADEIAYSTEFREKSEELETEFNSRKTAFEELTEKISTGEQRWETHRQELEIKIADREKTAQELESKIANCRSEFEKLTDSRKDKQKEIEGFAITIAKNQELIRSATERLSEVESRIQKGLDEISQSRETQESLENESLALTRIIGQKSVVLERFKRRIKSGGAPSTICPPLRLINPGMSSLVHYFHHGAGIPDEEKFNPIGFHGFAACTKGSMHRDADTIMSGDDPVLLILTGEPARDRALIESVSLGMSERILLVCWDEGMFHAFVEQSGPDLTNLLNGVSGIVSIDSDTAALLETSDPGRPHINLPFACPVEFPDWDLSTPIPDRTRGMFICGDGFDSNSPVHRTRLELLNRLAADTKTSVTLCQQEPAPVSGFNISGEQLQTCEIPLKYSDYLRLAGQHYLVTGFGKNSFGSDVTGDAVLARSVYIGADSNASTENQLLFPDTCITADNFEDALKNAARLLSDKDDFHETMERVQSLAIQLISFDSIQDRLGEFIQLISGK